MSDKVRELARKILPNGARVTQVDQAERILRAELKPLLDAAAKILCMTPGTLRAEGIEQLSAELQGWTASLETK